MKHPNLLYLTNGQKVFSNINGVGSASTKLVIYDTYSLPAFGLNLFSDYTLTNANFLLTNIYTVLGPEIAH